MSSISLMPTISVQVAGVTNLAALPPANTLPIGSIRVTLNDGALYVSDGVTWNAAGGGGGGGVTSVNGQTGVAVLQVGDGSIPSTGTNILAYSDASNQLNNLSGWNVDPTYFGLTVGVTQNVIDDGYHNWNFSNMVLDPSIASPTATWAAQSQQISIDPTLSGFDIGTNGQAALMHNYYYSHQGQSDTGTLQYITCGANLGNGTDAITIGGILGVAFFPSIEANCTIDNQLQGFTFSPNCNASSSFTTTSSVIAYGDFAQFPVAVMGYTTFGSSPTIGSIQNNSNYTGINLNPTITTMTGNAGINMISINGNFTNLGTGGYQGIIVNSTIATMSQNCTGINVSSQTTSGTGDWTGIDVQTNQINTTGSITGLRSIVSPSLSSNALDAQGHSNISVDFEIVDGQGQVYGHVIGGQVSVPAGVAITGSDVIANNMAFTVNTGSSTSSFTASSPVGITTLGFVGQLVGDGDVSGEVSFCLNGYSMAANTGTIDRIINFNAASIPGGGTATINETILFYGQQPFGSVGTDNWGLRIETATLENYVPTMAMGSMASKKVASSSVILDLDSTTKALLVPRMSSADEAALTPIDGMIIYNTTLSEFRGYKGGVWSNL